MRSADELNQKTNEINLKIEKNAFFAFNPNVLL